MLISDAVASTSPSAAISTLGIFELPGYEPGPVRETRRRRPEWYRSGWPRFSEP